jgi:hypothetical protein
VSAERRTVGFEERTEYRVRGEYDYPAGDGEEAGAIVRTGAWCSTEEEALGSPPPCPGWGRGHTWDRLALEERATRVTMYERAIR